MVQIQNGGRQSASFGAHRWRERSGGQISAQPAPLDSPESGHHPHLLLLDHRGSPGLQHRAFFRKSTVQQCDMAPGRWRERSGACARAVPMGDRRPSRGTDGSRYPRFIPSSSRPGLRQHRLRGVQGGRHPPCSGCVVVSPAPIKWGGDWGRERGGHRRLDRGARGQRPARN